MVGLELVPGSFQFLAKLLVIVNLTVKSDDQPTVGARHRLLAVSQIDDSQDAMPQEHPVRLVGPQTLAVRTPMGEAPRHLGEDVSRSGSDKPCDSAHIVP